MPEEDKNVQAFEESFEELLDEQKDDKPSPEALSALDALASRLREQFRINEIYRGPKEQEWIENLRQHKGIYDPETALNFDKYSSKVYPKITQARDDMAISRLHEMLFPSNDRNWEIGPTPVPKVTKEVVNKIRRSMVTMDPQTGAMVLPTPKEIQDAIYEYAKLSSDEMQTYMDDQLLEMDYNLKVAKPTLRSGVIYGTGLVKGPLVNKWTKEYYEAEETEFVQKSVEMMTPYFENTSIWNWYPDMHTTDADRMEGAFERHIMNKHEVRLLSKRSDFFAETIKSYLLEHSQGDATVKSWENDLKALETGNPTIAKSAHDTTGEGRGYPAGQLKDRKYEVLEYWGFIDGEELKACGVPIAEDQENEEIEANVWVLGNKIIKGVINEMPGKIRPWHTFYFKKDETSIFGEGLPRSMRDSQLTVCGASRMMLNNAAICSGPQFEINMHNLVTEDVENIHPMKVWVREGKGMDAQYPAVRVYHIESHIEEYLSIIKQFMEFVDTETNLPNWLMQDPGQQQNETVGATSMRMSSVTITLKDIVKNFDDFTEGIIESLYKWNMSFSDNEDVKGDYAVKAKGSSSLVMKEVRMHALNQFALTVQPEDWAYIPRGDFLRERVKVNDLQIKVRNDDDAEAYMQRMTDQKAKELAYKQAEADIAKTQAMALSFGTKAKKVSVDTEAAMNAPPDLSKMPNMQPPEQEDPIAKALEHQRAIKDMDKVDAEISHIKTKEEMERKRAEQKPGTTETKK